MIRRYFRDRPRAPLAIAAFISIPLFFSALMSATLALEKPRVVQWNGAHKLITAWHDPTTGNVATVWLWAMLPSALLVLVGLVSVRLPLGFYISCAAAVVLAMAVVHKTATWEAHHTKRFSLGVDLIPASNVASDKYGAGFWEHEARQTALSLEHWTISLALISIVVVAGLTVKRRYFIRRPATPFAAIETIGPPSATMPDLE